MGSQSLECFTPPFSLQHMISKRGEFTLVFQNPQELFYLNMILGFKQLTLTMPNLLLSFPKQNQTQAKLSFHFCQGYCMARKSLVHLLVLEHFSSKPMRRYLNIMLIFKAVMSVFEEIWLRANTKLKLSILTHELVVLGMNQFIYTHIYVYIIYII